MSCLSEHIKKQIYFDSYNEFTLSIQMEMSKFFTLYTYMFRTGLTRNVSRCVNSIETSAYLKLFKYL